VRGSGEQFGAWVKNGTFLNIEQKTGAGRKKAGAEEKVTFRQPGCLGETL
jgi:hypothetical protein